MTHRSVLVERIPPEYRSDTALRGYFERLFPPERRAGAVPKVAHAIVFLDLEVGSVGRLAPFRSV